MRICYLLLSPTFGMHQYTADYANRMAQDEHTVSLITTKHFPSDRYLPAVHTCTPVALRNTGFSSEGVRIWESNRVVKSVLEQKPDVVHITGPHLWNLPIMRALQKVGIPVIHTLHDLDPHPGMFYGPLLYSWNRAIWRRADHILVHGRCYQQRFLDQGFTKEDVTYAPLLHLFLGSTWLEQLEELGEDITYDPYVLFFGRLELYKGVADLIMAWARLPEGLQERTRLILAGRGTIDKVWGGSLPAHVEVRNGTIKDKEALELFQHCALLVLPYIGATQSALIPAAYFFRKPVIATYSGALPEYVEEEKTGWLIDPGHPPSLTRVLTEALSDFEQLASMGETCCHWYGAHRKLEAATIKQMYMRFAK